MQESATRSCCATRRRDRSSRRLPPAASISRARCSYARRNGGPALRRLTFHERAALLKRVAKMLTDHKDEFYALSYATGATKADSWIDIDGGFGTLFAYASRGARELPNSRVYVDGDVEMLSKTGTFIGQHICVPLEGAAVHINAFNFPVWGMLEKLAPTLLAGMPAIVKPATATAYLTELVVRRIVESGILPEGALQLVCGSLGDAFDHLTCQDVVSFTGSASTAQKLRTHPTIVANSVRFISETDSINSCVLGPDAAPGQPEFDSFVREVMREMTAKAGQKCTAIRKAIVPAAHAEAAAQAIKAALAKVVVGDPRLEQVRMGPLAALGAASRSARAASRSCVARPNCSPPTVETWSWRAPIARRARSSRRRCCSVASRAKAKAVHAVEAFGPVCTVMPYASVSDAITLRAQRRGQPRRLGVHRRRRCCARVRARARAAARPAAGGQSRLRQGIDRARFAAARARARRPGPRGRRRRDGRHSRRHALHAAHGDSRQPADDCAHHRPLDARRGAEGARTCIRSASRSTSCRSATR